MFAWVRMASAVGLLVAAAALQGCSGGGSGSPSIDASGGTPPPTTGTGDGTVLEKYRNYLSGVEVNDAWPEVGDYTHHFHYLLSDPVGDGLFAIVPTNVLCQEESCWASEASASVLGTVTSIQRAIEHANIVTAHPLVSA